MAEEQLCRSCTTDAEGTWPTWAKEYVVRGKCSECGDITLVLSSIRISWACHFGH